MFLKGKLVDRWRASTANGRLPSNEAFKIFGKATWEKRKFPFLCFEDDKTKQNKKKTMLMVNRSPCPQLPPSLPPPPRKMLIGHVKAQSAKNNLQWEIFKILRSIPDRLNSSTSLSSKTTFSSVFHPLLLHHIWLGYDFRLCFYDSTAYVPKNPNFVPIHCLEFSFFFFTSQCQSTRHVPPCCKAWQQYFFFLNAPLDTSDTPFYIFAAVDVTSFQYDNSNSKK